MDTLTVGRCMVFNNTRPFPARKWFSMIFNINPDVPFLQVTALSEQALPRAISGGQYERCL